MNTHFVILGLQETHVSHDARISALEENGGGVVTHNGKYTGQLKRGEGTRTPSNLLVMKST